MIPINLKVISLLFLVILVIIITVFVRENKISVRYSIIWYLSIIFMMFIILFPKLVSWLLTLFQIKLTSNFIFILLIGLLIVLTISLTIIVSELKEQVKNLTQEISILKSKK